MTLPSLPTQCGKILILAGITFGLTATLVKGAGTKQCGANSLCGYGSICDTKTSHCVCFSGKDGPRMREGNPFSTIYCYGKGVTECGDQLCGYRAECNTDNRRCGCSSRTGVLTELTGTFPSLWYCLESCSSDSSCNNNTRCTDPSNTGRHWCTCLPGTTLSPTGQCLGGNTTTVWTSTASVITHTASPAQGGNTTTVWTSTANVTTHTPSPAQGGTTESTTLTPAHTNPMVEKPSKQNGDDPHALTIGLAAGIGGVLLVAGIILVVVILARRRKSKRTNGNGSDSLRGHLTPPNPSRSPSRHIYQSVVDPPLPGQSGMDNPAGPTVIVRNELSVIIPPSRPGAYEDLDNDFAVIYSTAKVTYKGDENIANQAQEANNAISLPSKPGDRAELKNVNDLYSNHTIPFNKTQQRKKKNQGSSENMENQYNTLYDLRPAESNTAGTALRGDLEYDEIKLQKV